MRTRTLIAAAGAAAALLTTSTTSGHAATAVTTGTASPHASCLPAWHLMPAPVAPDVTAPSTRGASDYLVSVSPVAGHQVMFGGYQGNTALRGQPWTPSWNGRSFTYPRQISQLPFSNVSVGGISMAPSSFDSTTDGWLLTDPRVPEAVGVDPDVSMAQRWHDGHWTMTPMAASPDPATRGVWLKAVSALSPSDAWAVGALYQVGPGNVFGIAPAGALIEHWDGTQWNIVPNPASAQDLVALWGLSIRAANDIWAVGEQGRGAGLAPFAEHWDGTAWHVVPVPGAGQRGYLTSVSADAADDAWAAGFEDAPGGTGQLPLIEHWDGTGWHAVPLPDTGSGATFNAVSGIYAASSSDVWVSAPGLLDAAFLHWDGSAWSTVPVPGPRLRGVSYQYNAIAGTGPDDVWAVGKASSSYRTLTMPVVAHLSCG